MKEIFRDRSFQLSIILTLIFLGIGIAFLLFGLADYSWVIFILLIIVLGISPKQQITIIQQVVYI